MEFLVIWVILLAIIGLPVFAIFGIWLQVQKTRQYFEKKGVPYSSSQVTGLYKIFSKGHNLVKGEDELYSYLLSTKSPYVGMAELGGMRGWYVTDLNLIRNIMVKDFDHFVNRRGFGSKNPNKFLRKMLSFMENEAWRHTRSKLSPTFTTSKIRRYFAIFEQSSKRLEHYIKKQIKSQGNGDVDLKQIFPKYALDVIASCAFGVDSQIFETSPGQVSRFEQMSKKVGFHFNIKFFLRFLLILTAPKVAKFLGVDIIDGEAQEYYVGVVRKVLQHRRQSGERREDFLQMLMHVQAGLLRQDEESAKLMMGSSGHEAGASIILPEESSLVLDDDDIVANGLMFLSAGFDTTQSLWLLTVYCLALEQDVQENLYREVALILEKYEGQVTYEAITEMSYLDMVVNETLRLYSPATRIERICSRDYKISGTDIVIEKGDLIVFPIRGVQRDPQNYPDPEKFIPERFSAEGMASRHPYAFLPFGHGPRNCLGMRFGLMQVKTSLVQIIKSFHLEPCAKTKIPLEFGNDPSIKPKDNLFLKMTIRK